MMLAINHPTTKKKKQHSYATIYATQNLDNIFKDLDTSINGLSPKQVEEKFERFGSNEVAGDNDIEWYSHLLRSIKNPFVVVLLCLAVISYFTKDFAAVVIISTMVTISILIQFLQEFRSNQAATKLKAMVTNKAAVLRRDEKGNTIKIEIPMSEIVPGDIVQMAAGDMVPADIRLIASRDVFVSQAILTGESLPVEKHHGNISDAKDNVADCQNMCLMGTNLVSGIATGVVISTGSRTYFGTLAKSLSGQRVMTSFDIGIKKVTWLLIRFMLVTVPVVLFLNGFTKGDWMQAFFFAISVAVGLTPEMFPVIVTSNLAKGAISMSRRKVIVKSLNAIQNFGAMNILCTDKTGTLTQDKIILQYNLDFAGKENNEVLELAYLNSAYQTGLKNLLDEAVIDFSKEQKVADVLGNYRKIDEIPFDFVRRRMSVIVEDRKGAHMLICKGAIEEVLAISTHYETEDGVVELDDKSKRQMRKLTNDLNEDGFRVICVSYRKFKSKNNKEQYSIADESGLVIKGFLAFLDPPKETAASAISALRHHGVDVKILTGDNIAVTKKICKEVELRVNAAMLGKDIENLTDKQLQKVVSQTTIFAKMSPLQKARVIIALQANGNTVGFLGDGINDAPALRAADIGISVDTAADIAKESAHIILLEKSLLVLEEGVIEGRKIFANIIKYIKMTASSNFGNIFSVLGASAILPFLPMNPIQLMTQSLLYHITQLAIPFDKVDKDFIKKPRKWDATDLGRFMLIIGPVSSIFDYATYGLMWYWFSANTVAEQKLFQSGWFIEGLLSQILVVYMIRTKKIPFLQSNASLAVIIASIVIIAVGLMLPYTMVGHAIGFVPLPMEYFVWLVAILLSYCVSLQLVKVIYIKKFRKWL